jgi:imidazoleglycerol-phosphate dehydratase
MSRIATVERKTLETDIRLQLKLDGTGTHAIDTGIPFFDHMLILMIRHGFFDLSLTARGDLSVDHHHTVEDVGILLGGAFSEALGERKAIRRYGHAAIPMDEALAWVSVDFSRRPYLVFNVPFGQGDGRVFDAVLAKEFFRALANHGGLNLHVNVMYGENQHHILEAVFKAAGRALAQAVAKDSRLSDVLSTKGVL